MGWFSDWHTDRIDSDQLQQGADKWASGDGGHQAPQIPSAGRDYDWSRDDYNWGQQQN
jgi:hypothetical protein